MESTDEKVVLEAEAVTAAEEDRPEEQGEPRGAVTFIILMATFYVVYWTISWIEIFATRGS